MYDVCEFNAEPEFEEPVELVLWASRIHLACTTRRQPVPEIVEETFDDAGFAYLYEALKRVNTRLLVSSTTRMQMHRAECPCRSFHEQALITALRNLQKGSTAGYEASMSAILPPSAVRLALTDMTIIASALGDIERFWPAKRPACEAGSGYAGFAAGSGGLH